jgi:hypothetical protein
MSERGLINSSFSKTRTRWLRNTATVNGHIPYTVNKMSNGEKRNAYRILVKARRKETTGKTKT